MNLRASHAQQNTVLTLIHNKVYIYRTGVYFLLCKVTGIVSFNSFGYTERELPLS